MTLNSTEALYSVSSLSINQLYKKINFELLTFIPKFIFAILKTIKKIYSTRNSLHST